jgi:SAM-dependent methyltransferase
MRENMHQVIVRGLMQLDLRTWRALSAAGDDAQPWFAADNGFTSASAMRTAHAGIVAGVAWVAPRAGTSIVDLGCGNGALLAAICDRVAELRPIGVERAQDRLAHAALLLPGDLPEWHLDDFFDCEALWSGGRRHGVVLLMLGRLVEVEVGVAEKLRRNLRDAADFVLGYAYPDWLDRYGGLLPLCRAAKATPMVAPDIASWVVPVRV